MRTGEGADSLTAPYDRFRAVAYAHLWAYSSNPLFYNYDQLGGDCTSFASQCVYAGSGVMNYDKTNGWYYVDGNQKSPSWSGVPFFYDFMTRNEESIGPYGRACALSEVQEGDIIQLSFDGEVFRHNLVVVSVGWPYLPWTTLVAAHSANADYRPLSSYPYKIARFLHIIGVRK